MRRFRKSISTTGMPLFVISNKPAVVWDTLSTNKAVIPFGVRMGAGSHLTMLEYTVILLLLF